jgi:Phytanoyl-CoA dioxygenase (PhyH)
MPISEQFRAHGFVVLRSHIEPEALAEELERLGRDAFGPEPPMHHLAQGTGTVTFRYAPMMCERTPVSLRLVDALAPVAVELLARPVLPGRAKGTWYANDPGWHRDSEHDIASIGVVTYLDAAGAESGALRVVPGSHADRSLRLPEGGDQAGVAVETEPGDVVIFDEHLIHGSRGGTLRRQWRVDFIVDPVSPEEFRSVGAWFDQSIPDERLDPGYDAARYPSYGPYWQMLDRPWTSRLKELGVYERTRSEGPRRA